MNLAVAGIIASLFVSPQALPPIEPQIEVMSISVGEVVEEPKPLVDLTEEELELLIRVTMAEAGNQGEYGQRLVVSVVFNRMADERFPESCWDVLNQKGQFSCVGSGAIKRYTPTEEVIESVTKELYERTNTEVLFFRTRKPHSGRTFVLRHKAHYFSK